MTNRFLSFAAFVTGTEASRLERSTPYSRSKVKALAIAVFVPTLMWVFFGFLVSYVVLQAPIVWSALIALGMGLLIFTLERLIVMGNGSRLMVGFRFALGLTIAFLGAQLVDLVVFQKDIENKLPSVRHQLAIQAMKEHGEEFDQRNGIKALSEEIAKKERLWETQQKDATDESSGKNGSGYRGYGPWAKHKQQVADNSKKELDALNTQMAAWRQQKAAGDSAAYRAAIEGVDNSLLLRIKAMHLLLENESSMWRIYFGFTMLMTLIEFLVVIFKLTMKTSAYEEEVKAIEQLSMERTRRLYGNSSPLLKLTEYHPDARSVNLGLGSYMNTLL